MCNVQLLLIFVCLCVGACVRREEQDPEGVMLIRKGECKMFKEARIPSATPARVITSTNVTSATASVSDTSGSGNSGGRRKNVLISMVKERECVGENIFSEGRAVT